MRSTAGRHSIPSGPMLYFREHEWMLVPGMTRFSAWIRPGDQSHEDILWSLNLRYEVRGAQWRRVRSWERPSLFLNVTNFQPRVRRWTDLESVSFWEMPDDEEFCPPGGILYAEYSSRSDSDEDDSMLNDHIWRIAGRDGRFLTVELAAFADGRDLVRDMTAVPVLSDGTTDDYAPEFWKKNAQLYLIEQVPFGTVTVQVPRNARDVEGYALGRARSLLGLDGPEHLELMDHARSKDASENIKGDIYVCLHFNGYYED